MRRLAAAVLALSLLGGCATFPNPINQDQLYDLKAAYGIALTASVGYKRLCVKKVATVYPSCRSVVPILQAADRKVQGALVAAKNFIANNPNVSSVSLVSAVQQALADFEAIEVKYGVK